MREQLTSPSPTTDRVASTARGAAPAIYDGNGPKLTSSFQLVPNGPLGAAISEDEIHDDDWMRTHAGEYVDAVEVDAPAQAAGDVGAVAGYGVTVTSPRWLEHLEPGQRWRSAAYS